MQQSPTNPKLPAGDEAKPLATRPPFDALRARQAGDRATGLRLSETNRGLRMILIAAVAVVAISWLGTVGGRYIRFLEVQQLVGADQDALRVMCAIEPPTEHQLGWMHICESAALGEPATPSKPKDN